MAKSKVKKAPPIDRAAPVMRRPKGTDGEKVSSTRAQTSAMQQSSDWGAATDVQVAVKKWNVSADDLEANAKVISGLKSQLLTAESKQRTLRRKWRASTTVVLGTVNAFCDGSADVVKGFAFDVRERTAPVALAAPENLTVSTGQQAGEVTASWAKGRAFHGFSVQHATNPADPATYSAPTPCTKTKYTLAGSPSGANVHFRVAAVDTTSPSGLSPWSAWAAGTAK